MFSSSKIEFWTAGRTRFLVRLFAAMQLLAFYGREFANALAGRRILAVDFPTFYVGGVLAQFNPQNLYNPDLNSSLQNKIWPELHGESAPFVYPPIYGLFLRPLALFEPNTAWVIFVAFHIACFIGACILLRKLYGTSAETQGAYRGFPYDNLLDLFCLLVLFGPTMAGVFGGQNSALSLLLFTAVLYLVRRGDPNSELGAGICCGIWFVKPQYPALLLIGMVCARRFNFAAGAVIAGTALYFGSVLQSGWDWPLIWAKNIGTVQSIELYSNTYQYCSLSGFVTAAAVAAKRLELIPLIQILSSLLFAAAAGCCGIIFYRTGKNTAPENIPARLAALLAAFGPLIVLLSPHSHFYDLVLCIPAALMLFSAGSDRQISKIAVLLLFALYFSSHRKLFPASPLVLIPVVVLYLAWRRLNQSRKIAAL